MDKEIFIAFATQKGGIGKTTLTVLTASYLHYVKGYNVAVVDCDAPQNSIADLRAREIKVIAESTYFKALACDHFRRVKKKAYPVVTSNAADALDDADKMLREEATKPDLVFFDLPGTHKARVSSRRSRRWITSSPPISADRLVVESTLQFAALFHENLITTGIAKTKGLHLFWTMVDGREKSELYDLYQQIISGMNIPMLETRLPDSKRFRRDLSEERKAIFRSTIFPMDNALMKGSNIRELAEEICSVMKIQRV